MPEGVPQDWRARAARLYAALRPRARDVSPEGRLARLLRAQERRAVAPHERFAGVDDDFWFWLHTVGYRESAPLRALLPALPPEEMQEQFTGLAGDASLRDGFASYKLFRELAETHLPGFPARSAVLDFGCGWGRILRFFLKDVGHENLWGVDCSAEVLTFCQQAFRWGNFRLIAPMPPTPFPDGSFDLIYSFSVFSHLSEEAHRRWLLEFKRLARPGGLIVATTRPREFIEMLVRVRGEGPAPSWLPPGAARAFADGERWLAAYDRGEFCHAATGGGGVLDASFFGETCIPSAYVTEHWAREFTVLDFIDDRSRCEQNVAVVRT